MEDVSPRAPWARVNFSSLAKIACFGATFAPSLLLPLGSGKNGVPERRLHALPYISGDLTCTNSGTITTSGTDGIDAPATQGNATTTNSGTVNSSGNVVGIRTLTDTGNATATNTGTVNVSGNGPTGILTEVTNTGNATTNNQGSVINTGGGSGIQTTANLGNATTNNSGTVSVSGAILAVTNPLVIAASSPSFFFGSNVGILTSANAGNATTNNSGPVNVNGTSNNIGIFTTTGFGGTGIQFGASPALPSGPTTATTNNSGNVNVSGNFSTGILTAAGFSSPAISADALTAPVGGNTATTNNSGNINVTGIGSIGIETTTQIVNTTVPATLFGIAFGGGNATTTNSGNIAVDGTVNTALSTLPEGVIASGSPGGAIGILTVASFGNATTVNSGNVNVTGFSSTGILTTTNTGNATTINSGNITVVGTANGPAGVCVSNCGGFNVGISTSTLNGNVTVINSGKISVTGPNNVGISMSASGTSTLVDTGTISAPGGIAIQFTNPIDPATLTLSQGAFTIGVINLIGAGDTVNVNAGNLNLTFNTLAGVNVTAPCRLSFRAIASSRSIRPDLASPTAP